MAVELYSLKNIEDYLAAKNNPQYNLPTVIHVAGTNGKGSTIAFMHAILKAHHKSCHVYTSPHLLDWRERIVISDKLVTEEVLKKTIADSVPYNLTVFEQLTAVAFCLFNQHPADFTLLEVGLGGRLDATNLIESPKVVVITPISFDHQEILGESLLNIATEKSGIIKPKSQVVIAPQTKEVANFLADYAKSINAMPYVHGKDWYFDTKGVYFKDYTISWSTKLSLLGEHQYINAATAIVALLNTDLKINHNLITQGLQNTRWLGRLQLMQTGRLHEIWFDGAHNAGGAEILVPILKNWQKTKPVYLIIAMKFGKNAEEFLQKITPYADYTALITLEEQNFDQKNCFYSPQQLAMLMPKNVKHQTFSSYQEALDYYNHWCPAGKILSTGSLYLYQTCYEASLG